MKSKALCAVFVLVSAACSLPAAGQDAAAKTLWQIGKPDGDNADFALAPGGFSKFSEDAFYVVGHSDAKAAWPYVQPGPVDAWAGNKAHTFSIVFGVKQEVAAGACALKFNLLDTHRGNPPKLIVEVNGQKFEKQMPSGGGDESVNGDPKKGKPHAFSVDFPASLLKAGNNQVFVTTATGSWILYDNVSLEVPPAVESGEIRALTLIRSTQPAHGCVERGGKLFQPVRVALLHVGDPSEATLQVGDAGPGPVQLKSGMVQAEALAPAVEKETTLQVKLSAGGKELAVQAITLKPVRKMTVYVLPHSHTDIGYTEIQTAIEKKQVNNLLEGIAYARKTADYPAGARFVWNVEVLWAADLYLRRLDDRQRADFFEAVKKGQVALCGMYLNELSGLCRPEELIRLFRYATKLGDQCGVTVDSAMLSDVPGNLWSTVPAMAQAGIRYFSTAPNYFDRIGTILRDWENKPFYWVGPDGQSKVLVWIPFWGYAMSHRYGNMTEGLVGDFMEGLEKREYPYDIAYVRWSGHGDNAVPDPSICEFVREWNGKYAWPKFIISSTSEAFSALEKRYGDKLPRVRGDWSPYWEDGAGSSALETAMNRASSDRLAQAETLFAMTKPSAAYPAAAFEDAWDNVLLYSEHTWGAHCSISQPDIPFTTEQWDIKRSYATAADAQSRKLLKESVPGGAGAAGASVDVYNTASWKRTEVVFLPNELSKGGDGVTDAKGNPVPSQRLASGELAVLVRELPPFSGRRYRLAAGAGFSAAGDSQLAGLKAAGAVVENSRLRVRLDEQTGGIVELRASGIATNLADAASGHALNDYLYLVGDDVSKLARNGPAKITVLDRGPLVASLLAESDAPGCNKLAREVRLTAVGDAVELFNRVDKKRLAAKSYHASDGKESVNFAFPFNVPGGEILMDVPFGTFRPELDQMPSACKNWLTVGSWADVANKEYGVTWVTLDAPLVQVGGVTANLLNSQTNPDTWRKRVEPTQKLYSWAMNNHWGTNYRAYQEGLVVFRFVLRPHGTSTAVEATRFAAGLCQPLVALPGHGAAPDGRPLLSVAPSDVLVTALKPSDDGKALIVRLFNAGGAAAQAKLTWGRGKPERAWLSDTGEHPGLKLSLSDPVAIPASGLVALRVEFAE